MDIAFDENHIALLQHRAKNTGDTILFKLPILRGEEPPLQWIDVTVAEFAAEVDRVASFLISELKCRGIPPRSVVSVMYSGLRHQDLVYAIALARASYIPQMLWHIFTDPGIVVALMEKAGSKMILYDPSLEHATTSCPCPKMALKPIETIESCPTINNDSVLPTIEELSSGSDICSMYQTSGSISGNSKVVPLTQKFFSTQYKMRFGILLDGKHFDTPNRFLSRGSICAVASMIQYLGCLYTGSCIVKPSKRLLSTEELLTMVNVCGLNRISMFSARLVPHIQCAKNDPAVLKMLQEMRSVSYSGGSLSINDDDWCFQNGIPLINKYASTECGLLMVSVPEKPRRFMQPVPGISYRFDPWMDTTVGMPTTGVDNPVSTQLLEFVLLADSPHVPQPQLLSVDGNFHTGDLFEKQLDGSYLFRGRCDDWIKCEGSGLIDPKAIEEKVHDVCHDLVKGCIVIGHLRPSPALFIEANRNNLSTMPEDGLKELILRGLEDFNGRRMKYECITDKRLIFIVNEGSLPRTTKGTFRRKVIEQKYQKELDAVYMSLYGRLQAVIFS